MNRCCSQAEHDQLKASPKTFLASVRNLREQESGDDSIILLIAECPRCPSTLALEVTQISGRLHQELCPGCNTWGARTDDSGKIQPHIGNGQRLCLGGGR